MRIKTQTLEGFIGIRDGRGRDSIDVDWAELVGNHQLVALVGANGLGKTTLLDNMTPYRVMPSRCGGSMTPGSFSYADHTYGAARKLLEWQAAGMTLRSEIKIGGGKTRKQEAYLSWLDDGEWKPYIASDGTLSDGKTRTYDQCVAEILGDPEAFFALYFAAQGRGGVSDLSHADMKALMRGMLGLDWTVAYGKRAATVATSIKAALRTYQGEYGEDQVSRLRSQIGSVQGDIEFAEAAEDEGAARCVALESELRSARQRLAELEAAQADEAGLRQRIEAAQAAAEDAKRRLAEARKEEGARLSGFDIETERHALGLGRIVASLKRDIERGKADLDRNRALIEREVEILDAQSAVRRLGDAITDEQEVLRSFESEMERLRELERARVEASSKLAQIDISIRSVEEDIAGTERRRALIDTVPCSAMEDLTGACQLLADAREAGGRLKTLGQFLDEKRHERDATQATADSLRSQVGDNLDATKDLIAQTKREIERLTAEREAAAEVARLIDDLDIARANNNQLREMLARLRVDLDAAESDEAAYKTGRERERQEVMASSNARIKGLEAALAEAQEELHGLPIPGASTDLTEARMTSRRLSADIQKVREENTQTIRNTERLRGELRALQVKLAEVQAGAARATRLAAELPHWELLTNAFGRDGIISLAVDEAGPAISAIANDLLLRAYGPRYTVSISTQRETKGGDVREAFEVLVFDADANQSKRVQDLSGGQRVWINDAMARAMALFRAQQAGSQCHWLLSDESDGALDPEHRRQFIDVKRGVIEAGGYDAEIFITHSHDVLDMVDAVIDVEDL